MGYRSDVAYAIYGDEAKIAEFKEYFESELSKLDDDAKGNVKTLIESSLYESNRDLFDDKSFLFYATDVKWYETFPTVQFFDRVYAHAESIGLNGEFFIMGEDIGDNEHFYFGNCDYVLQLSREISIGI